MFLKESEQHLATFCLSKFLSVLTICAVLTGSSQAFADRALHWVNPIDRYSVACKMKVLRKLGWSIRVNPNAIEPQLSHDPACYQATQSTTWRPHNVLVLSPAQMAQLGGKVKTNSYGPAVLDGVEALDLALHADGSRCLFQQKYNRAVRSAIGWLSSDHLFQFPLWTNKDIWISSMYWHRVGCVTPHGNGGSNICYMPEQGHVSQAIEELQYEPVLADCNMAVDIAEYLAIDRVFGSQTAAAFGDYPWRPNSESPVLNARFYIGPDEYKSTSVLMGKYTAETFEGPDGQIMYDWSGLARASLGPQALIGSMGEIEHVNGPKFLDDLNNQAENFIIDNIGDNAVRALQSMGGIKGFDANLIKIWQLAEQIQSEIGPAGRAYLRGLVKVNGNPFPTSGMPLALRITSGLSGDLAKNYVELSKLLRDPFLQETRLYVHPLGVNSIAYYLARLAVQNPRTPYKIRFTYDTIHGEIFNRWIITQLNRCDAK